MASKLPGVVFSTDEMFMCSDAGQVLIREKIAEYDLNRVVVASCSPRMHEPTFRRVVEEAGGTGRQGGVVALQPGGARFGAVVLGVLSRP